MKFSEAPIITDVLPTIALLGKTLSGWSHKNFPLIPIQLPHSRGLSFSSHLIPPYGPLCQVTFKMTPSGLVSINSHPVNFKSTGQSQQSHFFFLSAALPYPIPTLTMASALKCLRYQSLSPKTPGNTKQCSLRLVP